MEGLKSRLTLKRISQSVGIMGHDLKSAMLVFRPTMKMMMIVIYDYHRL